MRDAALMRTNLEIDDDVLAAAKKLARAEHQSLGKIISGLARTALRRAPSRYRLRNGVPLLPVRPDAKRVTLQMVRQLQEERDAGLTAANATAARGRRT
jgi:hypothetical protein